MRRSSSLQPFLCLVAAACGASLLTGCAGGMPGAPGGDPIPTTGEATGSATIRVAWPAVQEVSTRTIPDETQSIVLTLFRDASGSIGESITGLPGMDAEGQVLLSRGEGDSETTRISQVPAQRVWFVAEAKPTTDGSGEAVLATGEAAADIKLETTPGSDPTAVGIELVPTGSAGHMLNPKDSTMKLILIPEGEAIFGADDGYDREKPQFTASLPAYYLGETEVTNAQYAKFLNDAQPGASDLDDWIDLDGSHSWSNGSTRCRIDKSGDTYTVESGWEDHPVVYVSWYGAQAYCDWAGLRLPSELEWEKGSRGTDGREYPWGGSGWLDGWDQDRCRNEYNGQDLGISTCEVFDYDGTKAGQKDGRSPWGLYNMSGNVWEWTADWYDGDIYSQYSAGDLTPPASGSDRVLRNGGWSDYFTVYFRCAIRGGSGPVSRGDDVGFRCARTP